MNVFIRGGYYDTCVPTCPVNETAEGCNMSVVVSALKGRSSTEKEEKHGSKSKYCVHCCRPTIHNIIPQ